jgi:hypothetical protein
VQCTLLLDLAAFGRPVDNVEGMTLGPKLPDGRSTLVLVSDNNFRSHQVTQLWALAFEPGWLDVDHTPTPAPAPVDGPSIAEIQGAAHRSPLEGMAVSGVIGVVTAVDPGDVHRLWLQSPAEHDDGDPATSEAVQVVPTSGLPQVVPGQLVRISGTVTERHRPGQLPVTTLEASSVVVIEPHAPLPSPVVLGPSGRPVPHGQVDDDGLTSFDPAEDAIDLFESVEGMRVHVPRSAVVGPTSRYGSVTVIPVVDDHPAPAGRTRTGALLETPDDPNPERIIIDDRLLGEAPDLATGSELEPLHGIVDYGWGRYAVLATEPIAARSEAPIPTEVSTLRSSSTTWTIATFNVENLSAVSPDEELDAIAHTIVRRLQAPDIVALQEIQDNTGPADDGVVAADATMDRLVGAIRAAGGPTYAWCQIPPESNADGGQPGGNIRVGLLWQPGRSRLVEHASGSEELMVEPGPTLTPSPARITSPEAAFVDSRKPLIAQLEVAGQPLLVVVVHFSSRGGDDRLFGARQPPEHAARRQRTAQAAAVAAVVRKLLTLDADARVVVLGDMNDMSGTPPLAALKGVGLVELADALPPADRYSYIFNGNATLIDHILVSPALRAGAAVDVVHGHADAPARRRASDHDPVVARFPVTLEVQ